MVRIDLGSAIYFGKDTEFISGTFPQVKRRYMKAFAFFRHRKVRQGETIAGIPVDRVLVQRLRKVADGAVVIAYAERLVSTPNIIFNAGDKAHCQTNKDDFPNALQHTSEI